MRDYKAFHYACENGYLPVVEYLIEKENIDETEQIKGLEIAVAYEQDEIVDYFLRKSLRLNISECGHCSKEYYLEMVQLVEIEAKYGAGDVKEGRI